MKRHYYLIGICGFILFNSSIGQELSFSIQKLAQDPNEICAVGDINNDGYPDISSGRFWFAGPDYVVHPLRIVAPFGDGYNQNSGEYLYDVNLDGWLDIVSNGFTTKTISWYQNPGKEGLQRGFEWQMQQFADLGIGANEIGVMHDLDKDGQREYYINSWEADREMVAIRFAVDRGGKPILNKQVIGKKNGHGIGFGDLNKDGKEDILFGNGWYEQSDIGWVYHDDWSLKNASCPMIVADVNQDGLMDVIYGNGHGFGLYWLEQVPKEEEKPTWKEHVIDASYSQAHTLLWEDIDEDGQMELITGKRVWAHAGKDPGSDEEPVLFAYHWQKGKQQFSRQTIAKGQVGTGLLIQVEDMNMDGRKDLIMAGKTGLYILFQN